MSEKTAVLLNVAEYHVSQVLKRINKSSELVTFQIPKYQSDYYNNLPYFNPFTSPHYLDQ